MSSIFEGDDIEAWKIHFKIPTSVGDVLTELGVSYVSDVELVYEDESMLSQVQAVCTAIEFGRFKRAQRLTNPSSHISSVALSYSKTATATATATNTVAVPSASQSAKATKTTTTATTTTKPRTVTATAPSAAPPSVFHKLEGERARNEALLREKERADAALRAAMDRSITMTSRLETQTKLLDEIKRKRENIKSIQKQIKDAASVDLCFVVDCTGSMSSYMKSVCDQIISLSTEVKKLHPLISIRFAFVGYRDHCDGSDRISLFAFSKDLGTFQAHVRSQKPTGGGDECEDVLGGLHVASNLDWTSQTRILFHVGDAPCHGREFHNGCGDHHLSGDPNGLTPSPILTKLLANNVLYNFGRINTSTDKMISKFNELIGSPYIATEPITASSFMTTVTKSVSRSVTESVSASFRTADSAHKGRKREVTLDASLPSFSSIPAEGAFNFELQLPADLDALTSVDDDLGIIREGAAMVSVKVAPRPFATGATRAAFYGEFIEGTSAKPVVMKESLYTSRSELTKAKYESFLACQRAAIFLAREFNKIKPSGCSTVNVCNASVLQLAVRTGQPFMCLEDKLNGTFEKYNSNSGYCAPFPTDNGTNHEAVQAFSHWTHHITGGYCMVVDCQGVYDRSTNAFTLTDPALHCRNVLRFGKTNLATVGMDDFFKGHVCNGVCAALRLPSK